MSNLYRGPTKDAFYQVFIWKGVFRGGDFLEINQSEARMATGHVC
jgi:hypothetical protein